MNELERRESLAMWLTGVLSDLWVEGHIRTLPYLPEVEEEDLGPHRL